MAFSFRTPGALAVLVATAMLGCPPSTPHKRPAEVPIGEYKGTELGSVKRQHTVGGRQVEVERVEQLKDVGTPPPPKSDALDSAEPFFEAKFGETPKAKSLKKRLNRVKRGKSRSIYQLKGADRFAGFPVKEVTVEFIGGKLGVIDFTFRFASDCDGVQRAIRKLYGRAQEHAKEASLWRGDNVGLRLSHSRSTCGARAVHKEFAPDEFAELSL